MVHQRVHGEVEFRFLRPTAQRVWLVGDFNGWKRGTLPMKRAKDGWWTCHLDLPAGVYQFQYLADGQPYLDYAAFGLERGPLGTWNSVVMVAPVSAAPDGVPTAHPAVTAGAPGATRELHTWTTCPPDEEPARGASDDHKVHRLQEV